MDIKLCVFLPILTAIISASTVRLSEGWHGRVEILHNGVWGTVCNDMWDDMNCVVVCSQLGYTGGLAVPDAVVRYGPGVDPIWLDDVDCLGMEVCLDQCHHDFWGSHNCRHHEDAGCQCDRPAGAILPRQGRTRTAANPCDQSRHRLEEVDRINRPGTGRVSVKHTDGQWYSVCDDNWSDLEASVFCSCLDYESTSDFHAILHPQSASHLSPASFLYDSVRCTPADVAAGKNLWECATTTAAAATGQCHASEAAFVQCQAPPATVVPAEPNVTISCDGHEMDVCFTSPDYTMSREFLSATPSCVKANSSQTADGVCMNIDIQDCPAVHSESDATTARYCYDISYSQFNSNPETLIVDQIWTRRSCCDVTKNGSVRMGFETLVLDHSPVEVTMQATFDLECFTNRSMTGSPLASAAQLVRGTEVYCRVRSNTQNNRLLLVVPDCRFYSALTSNASRFSFLTNRCQTTGNLGLDFFSYGANLWGFKFLLPKFQGYDQVYLSCDSYVCDEDLDDKPYCDRSCSDSSRMRRRRSTVVENLGARGETQEKFVVIDHGFGPIITLDGRVELVATLPQHHNAFVNNGTGVVGQVDVVAAKETSFIQKNTFNSKENEIQKDDVKFSEELGRLIPSSEGSFNFISKWTLFDCVFTYFFTNYY